MVLSSRQPQQSRCKTRETQWVGGMAAHDLFNWQHPEFGRSIDFLADFASSLVDPRLTELQARTYTSRCLLLGLTGPWIQSHGVPNEQS